MARRKLDALDSAVGTGYAWASAATTGIGNVSLFGIGLKDTLVNFGATEVSIGFVVAVSALLFAWATNDHDFGDMDQRQVLLVVGGLFVLTFTNFVPGAYEAVTNSQILAVIVVTVEASVYGYLAWWA